MYVQCHSATLKEEFLANFWTHEEIESGIVVPSVDRAMQGLKAQGPIDGSGPLYMLTAEQITHQSRDDQYFAHRSSLDRKSVV